MVYKCETCGKEYDNISAAQACEENCAKEKLAEVQAKEQAELELKKDEDKLSLLFENLIKAKHNVVEAQEEFDKKKIELREKYPNSTITYDSTTGTDGETEVTVHITPIKEYNGFDDFNKISCGE